jgi:serine/threonine protein kinase
VHAGFVLLDRYELLRRLGEGANSAVWEARDLLLGEHVAIKVISLDEAGWRAEVRDRFQQEARLLSLGRHQHLVGVRDVGETDDGYLFIVLDKLTGETLAERIARTPPLGWQEAARIALQIARGLSFLHARGIVHRDLKPANVILHQGEPPSAEPVAKIIDLGISKVRAAAVDPVLHATLTSTGQVLGTPAYMSCEQALGARDVDVRSDVWAVGVVLYEMLAGKRPFEAPNVNAVLAAIRKGAPPSLKEVAPAVPAALVAVVECCLEKDKDARFHDGAALSLALEAAVAQGERRPRRLLNLGLGLALAVPVAIGLLLLFPSSKEEDAAGAVSSPSAAAASTGIGAPPSPAASTGVGAPPPPGPSDSSAPPPPAEDKDAAASADGGSSAPTAPRGTARPGPGQGPSRKVTRINDAGF